MNIMGITKFEKITKLLGTIASIKSVMKNFNEYEDEDEDAIIRILEKRVKYLITQDKLYRLQSSLKAFFKEGSPQENHGHQSTTCGFCSLREEDGHSSDCVWRNLYEVANKDMGSMPALVDSDRKRYKFES